MKFLLSKKRESLHALMVKVHFFLEWQKIIQNSQNPPNNLLFFLPKFINKILLH